LAFVFLYGKINGNNQKAQEGMVSWQTEMSRRDSIRLLDRSLEAITDDTAMLDAHFAQSSDVVPFLDAVEKLARDTGTPAKIDSVDTSTDKTELVVGLTASGSFPGLYKFLTLLENSPYVLNFLSVDLHNLAVPDASGKIVNNLKWEGVFSIQLLSFAP
jgi:hypothetical protein